MPHRRLCVRRLRRRLRGLREGKAPGLGRVSPAETHEGHYGDPNCIVPAKPVFGKYNGGYEWYPLVQAEGGVHGATLEPRAEEPEPATITFADGYQITCDGPAEKSASSLCLKPASRPRRSSRSGDASTAKAEHCHNRSRHSGEINTANPYELGRETNLVAG